MTIFAQWYNAAIDITESKFYKPIPPKKRRAPPENTCYVPFHNNIYIYIYIYIQRRDRKQYNGIKVERPVQRMKKNKRDST